MTDASSPAVATRLTRRTPCVDGYLRLRDAAGLSPCPRAAAERGLPNTLIGVVVETAGQGEPPRAVGMGRIVGVGGLFAQVTDIALEPALRGLGLCRGRGLGEAIMTFLMQVAKAELSAGLYLSLMADPPADRLYARHGFAPAAPRRG